MRILRAADYRVMPWKNGGGTTTEIMVSPDGAGLDDFDWRVSMARVEGSGPFSSFAGIDRTLSVLEGEGIALDVAGLAPVHLTRLSSPFSFPADVATSAELLAGAVRDFLDTADDEVWTQLVGIMTRAEDPGIAALRAVVARALPEAAA